MHSTPTREQIEQANRTSLLAILLDDIWLPNELRELAEDQDVKLADPKRRNGVVPWASSSADP
jgi:hypothetical protein